MKRTGLLPSARPVATWYAKETQMTRTNDRPAKCVKQVPTAMIGQPAGDTMPPLNAPDRLRGRISTRRPESLANERALWIYAARSAGYSNTAIGEALGISGSAATYAYKRGCDLVENGSPVPNLADRPAVDRDMIIVRSVSSAGVVGAVSVPSAPWPNAFQDHNNRHETRPRLTLVKPPKRKPTLAEVFMRELRADHAEVVEVQE